MKPLKQARPGRPPKLGTFTNHTHPFVVFMWEEIVRQGIELRSVSNASGIDPSSIHKWRRNKKGPYVYGIEAVLAVLGYEMKIVKKGGDASDSH